ncbi:type II secretion system protein J [Candidatus Omnitrophota bacterium]
MKKKNKAGFTLVEVLVVLGIFTLAFGLSFAALSTSRLSANINEAQIQAQELARRALQQITNELRSASPTRVQLFNGLLPQANRLSGNVVFFQVPLETPAGDLNLTAAGDLQWGSKDVAAGYTANQWISYSAELIDPNDPNSGWQLVKRTHPSPGGAVLSTQIICRHISDLDFTRTSPTDPEITVQLVSTVDSNVAPLQQTLRTRILLRNQ